MDFAAEGEMGYGLPGDGLGRMLMTPKMASDPHEAGEPAKNFGADINTLVELLESGKL